MLDVKPVGPWSLLEKENGPGSAEGDQIETESFCDLDAWHTEPWLGYTQWVSFPSSPFPFLNPGQFPILNRDRIQQSPGTAECIRAHFPK
jgi:hypothetical protein